MSSYAIYYQKSNLNIFENVSSINETSDKKPFGYSFNDHVWSTIKNKSTDNIIGYIIVNSYYVNTNTTGGYVIDDSVVFIEKELPIGSINYTYSFYTPNNDTLIPPSNNNYPTPTVLTGDYYDKKLSLVLDINESETRTLYFDIN